jgi:cysteine desulfurase
LPVDKYGLIDPEEVKKAIKKETILVSIMHANNEIGTIEPIEEIGEIVKSQKSKVKGQTYFHTDAAQTLGKIPIDVNKMNIDLLTASSHKMYGPKGVACLFIREGTKIEPLLHGGGHEAGLRSSTVNVAAIVGFAEACKVCKKEMKKEVQREIKLRDKLIKGVLEKISGSHLNGHPKKRLQNNANFWFEFVEGESMVIQLDLAGIAASTGSACSSAKLEPSHVLLAIGLRPEQAHGSLRLTLGRWTTEKEINYVLKVLPEVIKKLRKISPFKRTWKE